MRISLFVTCYNDTLSRETGRAVVTLIERLGHSVEFRAAQTCCGQMHYNTGYQRDEVAMMRHFLKVFRRAETICIPTSSCVAIIRDHFPKIASELEDPATWRGVEELVPRAFELSELLIGKLGVIDAGAFFPHTVPLHPSERRPAQ